MSKKQFVFDTLLNIMATAIPLLILQLVTLPIVGATIGGEKYGLVVTMISLFTILSLPFGNVLNNIRLLFDNEYKQQNIVGDFNLLLALSMVVSLFMIILGTVYYEGTFSVISIFLMILISSINLLREYLMVSFRLKLNYKGILVNNLILGVGYIVGTGLFYLIGIWQLVFIIGYGFSLFYIARNSSLLKETFATTKLFKKTSYNSLILFFSSFIKNILTYADKLLLFPLLGPTAVSVYYTASILGKIISMIISPVNGVILSYLTKMDKLGIQAFIKILIVSGVIGLVGYSFTILISPFLLHFLYPAWAAKSMELIYITSATAILEVMSSVMHPFILRFNNINWQLFINGSHLVVYIISTLSFFYVYGLFGFCIGILIASIYKLLLMVIIFLISSSRKTTEA